jgi:hypothetical protein
MLHMALLLTTTTTIAMTAPPPEVGAGARQELRVDVGLASALGFGGVAYSRQVSPRFLVEAGAGGGLTGLQLSVMPKLMFGEGRGRFTVGVGVAAGLFGAVAEDSAGRKVPALFWLNVDGLGYSYHADSGLALSVAGGVTMLLSDAGFKNAWASQRWESWMLKPIPQGRIGIGYWF